MKFDKAGAEIQPSAGREKRRQDTDNLSLTGKADLTSKTANAMNLGQKTPIKKGIS